MKCLAYCDTSDLHSQLLHVSPTSEKKCTDRIIGWRDSAFNVESNFDSPLSRSQDTPKEKQMIRDFMQRNAPTLSEKQYKFQHHLEVDDYILQYRLQHTIHLSNSASLLYLNQFASLNPHGNSSAVQLLSNGGNSTTKVNMVEDSSLGDNEQPEIGSTYLNGVWTIAQKYHLAPPSLSQYTNWWKFNDQGKIEQDSKIPVFGKGITPSGRNMPVTKCNLRFPSETSTSAHSKKRLTECKKGIKEELEKSKELINLKNEDLRDASCKFFTVVLEQRLNQLKEKQDELKVSDRPSSTSSLAKRKSLSESAKRIQNDTEILEVTGRIPLFPSKNTNGHRSSLPHVPPVSFMSVREFSEK